MKSKNLRHDLGQSLVELMARFNFFKKGAKPVFVRQPGDVAQVVRFFINAKRDWIAIRPAVFVGWFEVNKIFREALARKEPVGIETFGFAISNEFRGRGEYFVEGDGDIPMVVRCFERDFAEIAEPFFAVNGELNAVESLLNRRNPDGSYVPVSVSGACKGLIAAKLRKREDLVQMAAYYYEYFVSRQGEEIARDILKVRDFVLAE